MHKMRLSDWFRKINAQNASIWLVQENKCTKCVYLIGSGEKMHKMCLIWLVLKNKWTECVYLLFENVFLYVLLRTDKCSWRDCIDEARFLTCPSSPGAESGEEGGELDADVGQEGYTAGDIKIWTAELTGTASWADEPVGAASWAAEPAGAVVWNSALADTADGTGWLGWEVRVGCEGREGNEGWKGRAVCDCDVGRESCEVWLLLNVRFVVLSMSVSTSIDLACLCSARVLDWKSIKEILVLDV